MEKFFYILFFCFLSSLVQAQPIGPSKNIQPQSKVENPEELDLPYKPQEQDELLPDDPYDPYDGVLIDPFAKKKPKVDWSKIPFVPSKTPWLPPLADPKI